MRRVKIAIGASAWLSLFILQLSGLHAHANEHGYVGTPETGYSHTHTPHHEHIADHGGTDHGGTDHGGSHDVHDFEDLRDVSFFELASGKFKISLIFLALIFLFSFHPVARTLTPSFLSYRPLIGRHTRWRPPLRAPPAHA